MLSEICTFHCCERSGLPNPKSDGAWNNKQELRITDGRLHNHLQPNAGRQHGPGGQWDQEILSLWSLEMPQEEP